MNFFKKIIKWIKSHKIAVALAFFLVLVAAIYLPPRIQAIIQGPEAKYKTIKPRKTDLVDYVDVSGEVKAEEQATLKFQTSGRLVWIGVKEGDWVNKWQTIASLDKRELEKKLQKEVYDYLSERWDFEQSHEDYDTSGLPLEKSILTDAAKRVLEKAQFDLNKSVLDLEIAKISRDLASIYSPIKGIVVSIDSPVAGVNITPATATFTIANPEAMIFEANVDEADIAKVKVDQKVIISLDAYPDQEITGEIDKINFNATTTRGGGTAFPIEVKLPENEDLKFKIGLNGDGEIIIDERTDVLSVPLETVKEKDGKSYVEIIKNKKIQSVEIETGISTDSRMEIITGLSGEEKVITGEKKKE